ncbi:Aldose 1-epimerase [Sorangium cellulosum So ce56]|uniref:Aldose 1-epimerase n=1 Tax=Sorangium cellulosum (strain So ce56) TaxID=448385 RepID=A9EUS1_SORC5|nr:Aldose 1-epimerase [Sorangium cellulosum So ce56]
MGRTRSWFGLTMTACLTGACGGAHAVDTPPAAAPPAPPAAPATDAAPAAPAARSEPPGGEAVNAKPASISKAPFGNADGKEVILYTLTNANGLVAKVMTYGATVTELHVPDKTGKMDDIVLGHDNLDGYLKSSPYFGATVGRVANRIKNAQFQLDGKTYKLAANNGAHTLHGGKKGWDKVVWDAEATETPDGPSITLTYVSKDGEEGYPGTVNATTTYTLTNKNELRVEMSATTDKTTIVNMAHHGYWNLGGHGSGSVADQELTLHADSYTPPDATGVPSGQIKPVKGTPLDFTAAKPIGRDLEAVGGKPVGYDHNMIVSGDPHKLREAARVKDPKTGRVLTIEADQPGIQFYTGNYLDGSIKGKGGAVYGQYSGLCLEPQKFPNSINVPAWKNEVILKPGQRYAQTAVFRFTTE